MPGLLKRALALTKEMALQKSRPAPKDLSDIEEQEALAAEIETLFTKRKMIVKDELREVPEKKKGLFLPLCVNASALVIIALTVPVSNFFLTYTEEEQAAELKSSGRTEGLLLEEMQRKSSEELQTKENRIAAIRRELEAMRNRGGPRDPAAPDSRRTELEKELDGLQSDTAVLLRSIAAENENQLFLTRQLQSMYQNVQRHVLAENPEEALKGLDAVNNLLAVKFSGRPDGGDSVDIILRPANETLKKLLRFQRSALDTAGLTALASRLAEINVKVARADELHAAGKEAEAKGIYSEALGSLETVAHAYNRLTDISGKKQNLEVETLQTSISDLNKAIAGLQAAADAREKNLARYKSETELLGRRLTDQTQKMEEQRQIINLRNSEVTEMLTSVKGDLEKFQQEVRSLRTEAGTESKKPNLVDLLGTKIALREAAGSKQMRNTYPELYSNFDSFFFQYGNLFLQTGKDEALKNLTGTVDEILHSLRVRMPGDFLISDQSNYKINH